MMAKATASTENGAPDAQLTCAAPDLVAEITHWLSHLRAERRLSPKTLEAYARDLRQCLVFLSGHWGGLVTLKQFAAIEATDVRAFMSARRGDDIGGRSLMRALAGLRSFGRFLEREGKGKVGALSAIRAPKIGKSLPKPIQMASAKQMTDADIRAGENREPWIWARDAAVMALLYGSGLRISEALGLIRRDVPLPGILETRSAISQSSRCTLTGCVMRTSSPADSMAERNCWKSSRAMVLEDGKTGRREDE